VFIFYFPNKSYAGLQKYEVKLYYHTTDMLLVFQKVLHHCLKGRGASTPLDLVGRATINLCTKVDYTCWLISPRQAVTCEG
jgi:hypothetical protein